MLLLGSFLFEDFEIPETVHGLLSGKQMFAVKKLIGGQRVIDAMGPDPADISWSGRFQGGDIVARGQQVASMREAGQPVVLVCDEVTLTVVIAEFNMPYERPYQGTYDIRCIVQPAAAQAPSPSLDDAVSGDFSSANSVISNAPTFQDAGTSVNVG